MKFQKGLDLNMLKPTAIATSLFFFFATIPAFAQETSTSTETPGIFTFLEAGTPAPFAGTLFSPEATAEILGESNNTDLHCKLKIDQKVAEGAAKCKVEVDLLKVDLQHEKEYSNLILTQKDKEIEQLTELANEPSYNWLWATGGVVAGILLTLGVVSAVNGITK